MRFTIILIFVMLLAAACHEKHDARLDGLEELMATAPDSALTILEELPESTLVTDFDKARHAMLLMMAKDKCYLPLQPDSNLLWANEVFHRRKDIRNEMKSRYYAGLAYRHIGEYRDALWEALNAIDLSHEAADTFWMGKSHDLAYEIYSQTYDYHNAAIEADKAAIYFKKAGAEASHRYALLEKAAVLNFPTNNTTQLPIGEGSDLLDSLIDICSPDEHSLILAEALLQKSHLTCQLNNVAKSMILLDSLILICNNPHFNKARLSIIIDNKIRISENPVSELEEFQEMLTTHEDSISFLALKKQYAISLKNWKDAFTYTDSLLQYAENILGDKTFNSIDEIALLYNNRISERKEKENATLRRTRTILLFLSLLIIVCISISFFLYHRNAKINHKKILAQILDIGHERDILKQVAESHEIVLSENSLLKKKLVNHDSLISENIELKQELSSQMEIVSEMIRLQEQASSQENPIDMPKILYDMSSQRLDFLGTRIDTLCEIAKHLIECESQPILQKSLRNNLMKEVKQLRSIQYKKSIITKVNRLHNDIVNRIHNQLPKATKGDLTWLGMVIWGFQPNTICFILDMEKQTFYSKRSRLRQYIELSNAPDKQEFLLYFPKGRDIS